MSLYSLCEDWFLIEPTQDRVTKFTRFKKRKHERASPIEEMGDPSHQEAEQDERMWR